MEEDSVCHCRKAKPSAEEAAAGANQLLLDENELAKGQSHCDVSRVSPSLEHWYMAYMVDLNDYETYTGNINDPQAGELVADRIIDDSIVHDNVTMRIKTTRRRLLTTGGVKHEINTMSESLPAACE